MSCIFGMLGMAKGLFAPVPAAAVPAAAAAAPQGLEAAVEFEFVDGKALLQAFVDAAGAAAALGAGGVAGVGVVFFLAPMTKKRVEPEVVTP